MKWRYGGVRHGALAGKRRDIAFRVLASLGLYARSFSFSQNLSALCLKALGAYHSWFKLVLGTAATYCVLII